MKGSVKACALSGQCACWRSCCGRWCRRRRTLATPNLRTNSLRRSSYSRGILSLRLPFTSSSNQSAAHEKWKWLRKYVNVIDWNEVFWTIPRNFQLMENQATCLARVKMQGWFALLPPQSSEILSPAVLRKRRLCSLALYCGSGANYKRLSRNKNTFPFTATNTESGVRSMKGVIFHSQFWKSDGRGQLSFGLGASTRRKRNFDFVTMAGYLTRFEDFYKVKLC